MMLALITSFLWMGPMLTPETGILDVLRNSSSASSEPSVEAMAYTPMPPLTSEAALASLVRSLITSSLSTSRLTRSATSTALYRPSTGRIDP